MIFLNVYRQRHACSQMIACCTDLSTFTVIPIFCNEKSKKLTVPYSLHNSVHCEVKTAMHLGVTNSTRAFLQQNNKTTNRCPRNINEVCYKTFVRPAVEYGAKVWDPASACKTQAVEQVQRRAARFVTSRYTRDDSHGC